MNTTRRQFITTLVGLVATVPSVAQVLPTYLRLVRRTGWEQIMGRNQCTIGDLYLSQSGFPISDLGTKICNVLELAYRNNASEISSVPEGQYTGFIRTDGSRGWRVEMRGTAPREHIQLHVGNLPSDSIGCLLPGTGESSDASCEVAGSKNALVKLQAVVGSSDKAQVVLLIQ